MQWIQIHYQQILEIVLKEHWQDFTDGLTVLSRLHEGKLHLCKVRIAISQRLIYLT